MQRKSVETLEQESLEKDREIGRLIEENHQLRDGFSELYNHTNHNAGPSRDDGLIGLAVHTWERPEGRVMLLACVLFLRMWLFTHGEFGFFKSAYWDAHALGLYNWLCGLAALYLFCKWSQREYRDNGLIQLLMKWALFGWGIYLAFEVFTNVWSLWWPGVVLLIFALLTISKLTQRLAERIGRVIDKVMELPLLAWAKGWLL